MSFPVRVAAASAVFLGLFAALQAAGSALGVWPGPPEGGFRGVDLAAGFAFGLVLLVTLLRPRRQSGLG